MSFDLGGCVAALLLVKCKRNRGCEIWEKKYLGNLLFPHLGMDANSNYMQKLRHCGVTCNIRDSKSFLSGLMKRRKNSALESPSQFSRFKLENHQHAVLVEVETALCIEHIEDLEIIFYRDV